METFSERLARCMQRADMTTSDAARWFDRPFTTMRTWLVLNRTPAGPAGRIAEEDLQRLEWAVYNDEGFPIPPELSHQTRIHYVLERRDGARRNARVPSDHPPA